MSLKLEGARELKQLLEQLPKRVRSKALRQALTQASGPILKTAKAKAPRDSGTLKRALGRKVKANTTKGIGFAAIGARKGIRGRDGKYGEKRVPSRYIHLVEKGRKPAGGHPGTKPRPFLNQAYEQNESATKATIAARFQAVIETEARKLGKL